MARVTFRGAGRRVDVEPGTSLLAVARREGLPIARACGGRGICDSCAVRVDAGLEHLQLRARPAEGQAVVLEPDWVMACLARVRDDAETGQEIELWCAAWGEDPKAGS